jgi:hypothetical protein
MKAGREMHDPAFVRPARRIHIPDHPSEILQWWNDSVPSPSSFLSIDIETEKNKWVSEIGIAASPTNAIWIPFLLREGKKLIPFWKDEEDEIAARLAVRTILSSPNPKVGQNFSYDIQYLLRKMSLVPKNFSWDTMIAQHSMLPGMEKSLGFLASIYCNEPMWKDLRSHSGKAEDGAA